MPSLRELAEDIGAGDAPQPGVAGLVGFRIVAARGGGSRVELEATAAHANPMGTLHGGILVDILDAAMGMAYASTLDEGESFTTLELKTNFLRPFWTGLLVATGQVVHAGRTIGIVDAAVEDGAGRVIARATGTHLRLTGDTARGR